MTTMNPTLKAYLDKLHAETRAQYDEIHKKFQLQEALFSKFDTGASVPQPAHSPVVASDGGLSIDAADAAVLPEVSSSTTKALEVLPDASLDSIDPMPVTCSTDCSNQVVATAVCSEPAVDLNDHEVEQLATARATPSIGTGTSSITEEVAPSVAATTDVNPTAGVEELDALPLFSINTSTAVTSEAYHIVDPSDLAAPTLAMCSTRPMPWPSLVCSHELHVKHARLLSQVTYEVNWSAAEWWSVISYVQSSYEVHAQENVQLKLPWPYHDVVVDPIDIAAPTLIICSTVGPDHLCDKRLRPSYSEQQPWPTPVQVKIRHMGHLFRPRPWPSFKSHSDASYPEEPDSGMHSQPQEGSQLEFMLGHAALCSTPSIDNLQKTVQTLNMSVWCAFWSQEGFKKYLGFALDKAAVASLHIICHGVPLPSMCTHFQAEKIQNWMLSLVELQHCPFREPSYLVPIVVTTMPDNCHEIVKLQRVIGEGALALQGNCSKAKPRPPPWPSFPCICQTVQVWSELTQCELPHDYYSSTIAHKMHHSCLPTAAMHLFRSVKKLGASEFVEPPFLIIHEQVRELANRFCLEKLLGARDPVYRIQEQGNFCIHQVLAHATVCSTHRSETLQGTMQIMSMSVQWSLLSLEEFQGSDHLTRDCSSEQYGDPCVLLACLMVQPIISRQMQGITLASCAKTIVTKLCQVQLFLLGNKYSGRFEPETMHLFSYKPITDEPSALITARARFCATFRNAKRLEGADVTNQQQHNSLYPWNLSCWNKRRSLLLIHASLGDFYRLLWDVSITAVTVQDVDNRVFFTGILTSITSMEYFWRECVIGPLNMPFLFTLMSNLCSAGGIIFTLCDSFNSLRNGDQLSSLERTTATYTFALTTSVQLMFSVGVEHSPPLCDNGHSSSDQGAENSTNKRTVQLATPYNVWPTRCLKLLIEGPSECLPVFQLKPPWHQYVLDCTVRRLMIVARISPRSVQFNSMEANAWTFAKVWKCKNCQLGLLCYNKVRRSFDAIMPQDQEMDLCTTAGDLLLLLNQRWYSLCCDCSCDLTNHLVVVRVEYPVDEVHQSLDPTMTAPDLQQPKILIVWVISKKAQAMSGMTSFTCYNQDHFQEGRGVVVATAVFAQGFVGHGHYLGFDCDCADHSYVFDASLDWISIHHNFCFYLVEVYANFDYHRDSDHVQEHRVHWDPGGCQWCRLGVKPSFKKGGMLGASCTVHGLPHFDQHMGQARLCATPSRCGLQVPGREPTNGLSRRIRQGTAMAALLPFPFLLPCI